MSFVIANNSALIKDEDLNPDQANAVDKVLEFLLDENEKIFHLQGPAGTGKTFTLSFIINQILARYEAGCKLMGIPQKITEVIATATTNKAAEVLSTQIGRPTMTIHKYLGLRPKKDFKTGQEVLIKTPSYDIKYNTLIIIDEASMIDWQLFNYLQESTVDCKFLYIGDKSQLAPVKEKESKIYGNIRNVAALTIPVRNSGQPALMALCEQFRETVKTGVFKPIEPVPGVIEYLNGPEMQAKVDAYFLSEDHDCRIICNTNQQAIGFNDYIRILRGRGPLYEKGEVLVAARAFQPPIKGRVSLSVEEQVRIYEDSSSEISQYEIDDFSIPYYTTMIQNKFGELSRVLVTTNTTYLRDVSKYFARKKMWHEFYNLENNFPDLRPYDACTAYKAQGSTYDTAFVDLQDISLCRDPDQTARMLYVAVSRAKNKLYLYGRLSEKYGG